MSRLFLFTFLLFIFSTSTVYAAIYKGHRVYVRECSKCHTDKQNFVKSKTAQEWKDAMGKDGATLKTTHIKDTKLKDSWDYFNSNKFTKKAKHLKEFLIEYSKDSGKVPAFD